MLARSTPFGLWPRRRFGDVGQGHVMIHRRSLEAERVDNEDGTVDLIGVEIMAVGGPVFGQGSPPEGDFWTLEDLRGMAAADAELGDELTPPNKIGHPDEQTLVANSIAAGELPALGEMPAVGWLEDVRVAGTKLLADVKHVPRVVADLIEKGAYRTRSVELAKITSQETGKTYDWVVTGLAWLGGKMPAVKTLGDVVKLYEGDVPLRNQRLVSYAVGEVVWSPEAGLEHLRQIVNAALNPGPGSQGEPARYWVRDVAPGVALVEDWNGQTSTAYVVPFAISAGVVTLAASSDWTLAEQAWVEVGRANEERALTLRESRGDTRAMRYTAEQRRTFAEATGLEESAVTDEMLAAAGVRSNETEPPPDTTTTTTTTTTPPADEPVDEPEAERALESRLARVEARSLAAETELLQERRNAFVETSIREGRIAPGQRETLETLFNRDQDAARAFVSGLPVRDDLLEELGSDDDRDLEEVARSYADEASGRLGIPADRMV